MSGDGQDSKIKDNTDEYVHMPDGIVVPKATVVNSYKNCSPTFKVLGKILKEFFIYFRIKENNDFQNLIEVLHESSSSSKGFERLNVEETSQYKPNSENKRISELTRKGILLSWAEERNKEEARRTAGIDMINALAETCFTIQTNYDYENNGRCPRLMLQHPENPENYNDVPFQGGRGGKLEDEIKYYLLFVVSTDLRQGKLNSMFNRNHKTSLSVQTDMFLYFKVVLD